jgi:guanylate kinase
MTKGPLIILSGPSGVGKSTVVKRLLDADDRLRLSVSATTRPERPGEVDGTHYLFWNREKFEKARAEGRFLEWAEVHGNLYGTLRDQVERLRGEGFGVILEIDVQGAEQVRRLCPENVSVFLKAPSIGDYEKRLTDRHTDDAATIRRRVERAQRELERAGEYDYRIVNNNLDEAVAELHRVVAGAFARR